MNFIKPIPSYIQLSLIAIALLFSCEDEFEQATVTFYPTLEAIANEPNEGAEGVPVTISLKTSRTLADDSYVNIRIEGEGAGYGFSYTTNPPQLEPGIITLTVPAGESTASFTFTPQYDGIIEQNDYHYTFTIEGANNAIRSIGQKHFAMTVREGRLRSFDFTACSGIPTGFTEQIVPGDGIMTSSTWACTSFGFPDDTPNALEANAFGTTKSDGASNSYLVLDVINATTYSQFYIDFEVYSRFAGPGVIKLVYSTDYSGTGNPEAATWTELTDINSQYPDAGSRIWKHISGSLEAPDSNSLYFAIQFEGGTKSSSANWRIDNFEIKAE